MLSRTKFVIGFDTGMIAIYYIRASQIKILSHLSLQLRSILSMFAMKNICARPDKQLCILSAVDGASSSNEGETVFNKSEDPDGSV